MEIYIADRDAIASSFGELGLRVGPRTGVNKRTHDEKEFYCLRRYIDGLARHKMLRFPIKITKGERPDFVLSSHGRVLGVEVTEATTEEFQRELTELERVVGDGDDDAPLSGDGWAGNSPENEACKVILTAISKKRKSIRSPNYGKADHYEILIYLSISAPISDMAQLMKVWRPYSTLANRNLGEDSSVIDATLIQSTEIVYDLLGNTRLLPLAS